MILREVTAEGDRDEVQHDRVDDFMRSKLRFQNAGNASPDRARSNSGDETERNQKNNREIRNRRIYDVAGRRLNKDAAKLDTYPRSGKCADIQLSFGADVQQAATKRESDCQSGKNQRRGIEKRVANAHRPRKSAAEKQPIGLQGIVTDDQDQDSADNKSGNDGDQGKRSSRKRFIESTR